jgi:ADP-heptose:LPS heptosyltransferase
MHLITIPSGISEPIPVYKGLALQAGKEYICTNAFAGEMLLSRWRVVINGQMWSLRLLMKAKPITFFPFNPTLDWNEKHIWLYRGGGWGDLLMLTPTIRELKSRWPKCRIHVACGGDYHSLFKGIDVITEYLPIPNEMRSEIDCLVEFEELVEGNPMAEKEHMAQLFANQLGLRLENLKPEYYVTQEELELANQMYPRNNLPRIGIQFLASAFYRSYPLIGKVMVGLAKDNEVFLFGTPGQIQMMEKIPNVTNLMADKLGFRQSAAMVSTCDACVSPDSAMVHLCSALDKPCVALYGPFPSELRVTSNLTWTFDGKAPCAPCFFHAETPDQFPAGMPCFEKKLCVALQSIDPERVIKKVLSLVDL